MFKGKKKKIKNILMFFRLIVDPCVYCYILFIALSLYEIELCAPGNNNNKDTQVNQQIFTAFARAEQSDDAIEQQIHCYSESNGVLSDECGISELLHSVNNAVNELGNLSKAKHMLQNFLLNKHDIFYQPENNVLKFESRDIPAARTGDERSNVIQQVEDTIHALQALAMVFRLGKQYDKALTCYQKAFKLQMVHGALPFNLLNSYVNVHGVLCQAGNFSKAANVIEHLKQNLFPAFVSEPSSSALVTDLVNEMTAHVLNCQGKEFLAAQLLSNIGVSSGEDTLEAQHGRKLLTYLVRAAARPLRLLNASSHLIQELFPENHQCYSSNSSLLSCVARIPESLSHLRGENDETQRIRQLLSIKDASSTDKDRSKKQNLIHTVSKVTRVFSDIDQFYMPHYVDTNIKNPQPIYESNHPLALWLTPITDKISSYTGALVDEYYMLRRTGKLFTDPDCIAVNMMNESLQGWRRYTINGIWTPLNKTTLCSTVTPVACELYEALRLLINNLTLFHDSNGSQIYDKNGSRVNTFVATAATQVVRIGYSSLDPGTWIRPHFGSSNGTHYCQH